MAKIISYALLGLAACLFSVFSPRSAVPQERQQFGREKGKEIPAQPTTVPLKENLCKNPRLCEALEIDLLDQLQKHRVPLYLPPATLGKGTTDDQASLYLGMAGADALAGIAGNNKDQLLKSVALMEDYGKRLQVSAAVLGQKEAITAAVAKGQWDQLGLLLYGWKDAMVAEAGKDRPYCGTLVMLGGGLEGFYLLAKSLEGNFSQQSAPLLNQKDFTKFLYVQVNLLPTGLKEKKEVKAILQALNDLDKLISKPRSAPYTKEDVAAAVKICESARNTILGD